MVSGIGSAKEIIVQPGSSIQTAVKSASFGDTITLKSGTYTENLNITKGNITIRSQSGNPDDTIIKSKSTKDTLLVNRAYNVTIRGIKVTGSGNSYSGIYLYKCNKCVIDNNKPTNNGYGIRLVNCNKCTVSKNTVINNGVYGIYLGSSSNTVVSGNTATNDNRGIHFASADYNNLYGNTVTSNSVYGLFVCGLSDKNLVYNNYFNNTNMTIKNGIRNSYNTAKTPGKNIVGGNNIGGNFWGKPDGKGFSNTAVDKNGDGISDTVYKNISGSIYSDYLPLVIPSKLTASVNSNAISENTSLAPIASFSSNVTSGSVPLSVLFNDTSTGSPTSWRWNFGDGGSSTQKNPTHKYLTAGNYTVALTVNNTEGNNTITKSNYITVTGASSTTKPAAAFSASPTSGNSPLNVTFTDSSTGSPTEWNWSFGDGNSSTKKSPTHTYSTAGNYTVALTVNNTAGSNTATKSNYITVTETSSAKLAASSSNVTSENTSLKPVAAFSASPTSGKVPLNVTFTDSSTGSPTEWNWSFGDGNSSTKKSPTHTYSTAGNYTVELKVTNTVGSNTSAKNNYIVVSKA